MEPTPQHGVKKYLKASLKTARVDKEESKKSKDPNSLLRATLVGLHVPPSKMFVSNPSHAHPPRKWNYEPILYYKNSMDQAFAPKIKSWSEAGAEPKPAYFTKFNISFQMPSFSQQDYALLQQNPAQFPNLWSYNEILHLFNLLELFEGNFLLVADRYADSKSFADRSVEDIKEQTFMVCKAILGTKGVDLAAELRLINYNKNHDKLRKFRTEKFLGRADTANRQEEKLLEEIRNLELTVRKKERENLNFKRIMEITEDDKLKIDDLFSTLSELPSAGELEGTGQPAVFSRATFLKGPLLNIPPLTNEKLELALKELEIPANLYGTEANVKLMDQLRVSILKLFRLNAILKQKEKLLKRVRESKKGKDQNAENEQRVFDLRGDKIALKKVKED